MVTWVLFVEFATLCTFLDNNAAAQDEPKYVPIRIPVESSPVPSVQSPPINSWSVPVVAEEFAMDSSNIIHSYLPDDERMARSGHANCLAPWLRNTDGRRYQGYYVGGGTRPGRTLPTGTPRYTDEGTWGFDYAPQYSRVNLLWSHGARYQGGTGQYEPDHRNRPFGQFRATPTAGH